MSDTLPCSKRSSHTCRPGLRWQGQGVPGHAAEGRAPIKPQHDQVVAVGQRTVLGAAVPGKEQQRVRVGRVRDRAVRCAHQQAVRVPATQG